MSPPSTNTASSTFSMSFGDPDDVHPVLIAGAGPAGTLLAFCLAKLGVRPLIVDSNHFTDHEWGRGDALLCRTVEALRSLGVGKAMIASGSRISERAYWDMTAEPPACINISDVFPVGLDIEDLYALSIRQGLVEKILTDATTAECGVTILRPWSAVDTRLDAEDPLRGPVVVTLKSQYGEMREVKARYVVGCDGGRSAVRRSLEKYGVTLDGDAHPSVWSAMDVVGFKTDFPDINKVAIVASAHGTVMIIPREDIKGMNCIRFYCEVDRSKPPTLEDVIATVHGVFHPYKFVWDEINWFTIYTVPQRIVSAFDVEERIFLAGDAAHLHSPKGALGMNTSLMDAHNLAIKIALVETGVAKPAILSTYALERRQVATHLVHMDAELIQIYADHGKSTNPEDIEKLVAFQRQHFAFQAGTNITYGPNLMVDANFTHVPSAMAKLVGNEGLVVGRRLLPAVVKRYSDGLTQPILDATPCDGRFTVFIYLVYRPGGMWARLETQSTIGAASVLRVLGVTTTSHLSAEAAALVYDRLGLRTSSAIAPVTTTPVLFDTSALYSDDVACLSPYIDHAAAGPQTPAQDILSLKAAAGILLHPLYQKWDIDIGTGGIVVLRPDGHVGACAVSVNMADHNVGVPMAALYQGEHTYKGRQKVRKEGG
ncbi:FAD binding domain-containing protein [Mycena rosella]|uniref:FAD binding domain-containing protein n=1 Tax=Mycena rosella TaxID=1033263 RepID=A0AAD7DEB5_MYCRO|nr:FAD binding domain-containing protein [Mycena rosella]